jgi:hypothetical protein
MDKSSVSPCNYHSNWAFAPVIHNTFDSSREECTAQCLLCSYFFLHDLQYWAVAICIHCCPMAQELMNNAMYIPKCCRQQLPCSLLGMSTTHHSTWTFRLAISTSVDHWRSNLNQGKCFFLFFYCFLWESNMWCIARTIVSTGLVITWRNIWSGHYFLLFWISVSK